MDAGETPLDIARLRRPEADAFRYIAEALGARFAGDPHSPSTTSAPMTTAATRLEPTRVRPVPRLVRRRDAVPADPRAAALLDRVPAALLVAVGDDVAFINRAAAALFGYTSAAILDASGGLGALFNGQDPAAPGVLRMVASSGTPFAARVTMSTVDWCGARGMLFTVIPSADIPAPPPPSPRHGDDGAAPGDALAALLDANPDPIALVARGGRVEACNAAFRALGGHEAMDRLDDRIAAADLRHVFDVMALAFILADGSARTTRPIRIGADAFAVTVGSLKKGDLACLVFHKTLPANAVPARLATPRAPANDTHGGGEVAAPLETAVRKVRALVRGATILIVSERAEGQAELPSQAMHAAETRLLQALLLAIAARAPEGTVLVSRRRGADYVLSLSPPLAAAVETVATAERMTALARAADRTLVYDAEAGITLRKISFAGEAEGR